MASVTVPPAQRLVFRFQKGGISFYRMEASEFMQSKKLALAKQLVGRYPQPKEENVGLD